MYTPEEPITPFSLNDDDEEIVELDLCTTVPRLSIRRRHTHGHVFTHASDSDSDSDSLYAESLPSYDNYDLSIRTHAPGPVKAYIKERLVQWPKHKYKKCRKRQMVKNQVPINYGSIHTKEIKDSLKHEKYQKKDDDSTIHIRNMMEELPKYTSFLSLDPQKPLLTVDTPIRRSKSASKLHDMKKILHMN